MSSLTYSEGTEGTEGTLLLKIVLDPSILFEITKVSSNIYLNLERATRNLCYAVHSERALLLRRAETTNLIILDANGGSPRRGGI